MPGAEYRRLVALLVTPCSVLCSDQTVVSASSTSVLVGREFDSQPGLIKTLQIGTAAFLPGARHTEELQGTQMQTRNCTNSVVALQDHCSYTGFPRSWKIIENPGKINFPGKSWKIDKNSQVMEKLKNH